MGNAGVKVAAALPIEQGSSRLPARNHFALPEYFSQRQRPPSFGGFDQALKGCRDRLRLYEGFRLDRELVETRLVQA